MVKFEMFYIFDLRETINGTKQNRLHFEELNNELIDEYILCETNLEPYTTYALIIPKEPNISEEDIKTTIFPTQNSDYLNQVKCYKFCDFIIGGYNVCGAVQKVFFEKVQDYTPIFKYTYPSYLHLSLVSLEVFTFNSINMNYYIDCIKLLQKVISDDFIINENYLSDSADSYFFRVSVKDLADREDLELGTDIKNFIESTAYHNYLRIKGLSNPLDEDSVKNIKMIDKKQNRRVFVFK